MKKPRPPDWRKRRPPRYVLETRAAREGKLLSAQQKKILEKMLHPEEIYRVFIVICKRMGLPRKTQDRIEHEFRSDYALRAPRIILQYNQRVPWETYLFECAGNVAIDVLRKTGRHEKERRYTKLEKEQTIEDFFGIVPEAEDPMMRKERIEALQETLQKIPKEQSEPIRMHYFEGKKYIEIAEIMDIPMGTVKSRIKAGKMAIRKILEHDPRVFP